MDVSTESIDEETTILELNDDCLREVFECLDADDLAVVADVCTRFRQNAVKAAPSKMKNFNLREEPSEREFSKLRNFGASIEIVSAGHGLWSWNQMVPAKYQRRLIEYLNMYCIGESIELRFVRFAITDDIALSMVPLLGRVKTLDLYDCQLSLAFLRNMSFLLPELRELQIDNPRVSYGEKAFVGLHKKFPKLEFLWLSSVKNVHNSDIEKFLKQNPQLKKIILGYCEKLDDSIYVSIVEYVPGIEKIGFYLEAPNNYNNIKYLGQMRALKSLDIRVPGDHSYLLLVVQEIVSAKIPLENLEFCEFSFPVDSQHFIEGVSKLKKLKQLEFSCVRNINASLTASLIIEMCKPLKELSKFVWYGIDLMMTTDDLLNLVKNSEKLQKFEYYATELSLDDETLRANINVDIFKKLLQTVESRHEKTPLTLELGSDLFAMNVSAEMIQAASDSLKFII